MEYSQRKRLITRPWMASVLVAGMSGLLALSVAAETYRWKDKDGKVHYGAIVPAEYADQPYDILNSAGIVIEHVEDTSIPVDVIEEKKELGRQPLISEEERRIQADKLLVIQYRSEDDITSALDLEIAQLDYDARLIDQSFESNSTSIRNQIKQAADRQRAGQEISADQQQTIDKLYRALARDNQRRSAMQERDQNIRARFRNALERYRFLTSENKEVDEERVDQG